MHRLVVVLLLACSVSSGTWRDQEPSPETALREAEARWHARKPTSYEFAVEVRCFCGGLTKTPPRFAVTNGEPRSLQELEPDSRSVYEHYNTVEKLFAAIRRSLSLGKYRMIVQYDADLGYPVIADLDPRFEVADDELVLKVTEFRATGRLERSRHDRRR
jgi:hypothetical protein